MLVHRNNIFKEVTPKKFSTKYKGLGFVEYKEPKKKTVKKTPPQEPKKEAKKEPKKEVKA